jgi:gentisate 1,2-dioxygenase
MALEQQDKNRTDRAEAYYGGLGQHHVAPLWHAKGLLPKEPVSRAVPHLWHYPEMRELLMQAGEVISAEDAERRVLMLMNPGLPGEAAAATNLYAGLQLLLPGETAPQHRHTAAALRLIVEGEGAYTTVEGERTIMRPGDLVLTPNWLWHDHGNETDREVIWLDGLDIPLVNAMEASFFDPVGGGKQELTKPVDGSARLFGGARLNPVGQRWEQPYSPLLNYPWARTEPLLREVGGEASADPAEGVILEYVNPYTGGPVLPTMSCRVQLLAGGLHTAAHRHTTSAVYHAIRGSGTTIVDGQPLRWQERDTFAVPGWCTHEHVNDSASDDAVLFSFTDDPVLRPLGLYREESRERQA